MPISRPPPRQAVSRLRPSPYNEPPTSARNKECGPVTADGTVIRACRSELPTDDDGAPILPPEVTADRYVFCWTDRQHGGDLVFTFTRKRE